MTTFRDTEWFEDALCAQVDPATFSMGQGESFNVPKRVCALCPVRETACLEYAMTAFEPWEYHTVLAGRTPTELKAERRRRNRRGTEAA